MPDVAIWIAIFVGGFTFGLLTLAVFAATHVRDLEAENDRLRRLPR